MNSGDKNITLEVVGLWAEDVPATAHFYRDVIGLKLLSHHAGRPHFDLGGVYLVILHGKPQPPLYPKPERFPILAFGVPDLIPVVERLKEHAVELPWGIENDASSRWAMFCDPAGNLIEIVQFAMG